MLCASKCWRLTPSFTTLSATSTGFLGVYMRACACFRSWLLTQICSCIPYQTICEICVMNESGKDQAQHQGDKACGVKKKLCKYWLGGVCKRWKLFTFLALPAVAANPESEMWNKERWDKYEKRFRQLTGPIAFYQNGRLDPCPQEQFIPLHSSRNAFVQHTSPTTIPTQQKI